MNRKISFWVFCGSIIWVGLTVLSSCGGGSSPVSAAVSIDKYSDIIEFARVEAQKTRNLSFKRAVKVGLLTREQFSRYNDSWSTSDVAGMIIKEFKQIGFIPDSLSNTNFIEESNDNFASAFYKPGTDSMYIIDASTYDETMLFMFTVHEFTHALVEQNFNPFTKYIYSGQCQSTGNSDFYFAQRCITEGDAIVNEYFTLFLNAHEEYAFDSMDLFINEFKNSFYSSLQTYEPPRYIKIHGYAPYQLGASFIWDRYKRTRDWNDVNQLYHANRPSSTREIITGSPGELYTFDFSEIMPLLLENTKNLIFADDDTYGPIMLMALLNEYVFTDRCKAAFGWQGDRLAYTLSDDRKYGSFVWAIKFETEADASYIAELLDTLYTHRHVEKELSVRTKNTLGISYKNIHSTLLLRRSESFVFVIENVQNTEKVLTALETPPLLAKSTVRSHPIATISFETKRKIYENMFGK